MIKSVIPNNSRYIPFTQQPYCCVPTCIQMVMYKNGIPLIPIEEIGYELGLIVPPEAGKHFYNARISTIKPLAGYGTRIYLPEYEPNHAFKKLGIPISLNIKFVSAIENYEAVMDMLIDAEHTNADVLVCFNHGALIDDSTKDWGHVVVFDRIIDGKIRLIDPTQNSAKWLYVTPEKLYQAMEKHGDEKSAGIWHLTANK